MRFKFIAAIILLAATLALAGAAQAMNSAHYRLPWFAPLTSSGGAASSAHYRAYVTVGQTVTGAAASGHYQARLGYWQGSDSYNGLYLPMVSR